MNFLYRLAAAQVEIKTDGTVVNNGGFFPGTIQQVISTLLNVFVFVIGAISVLMIVIGGFLYVTSAGDSGRTKTARETILYAVVGLIVAMSAYAIVLFFKGKFV